MWKNVKNKTNALLRVMRFLVKDNHGYSFIELIMIITILGIVTAVGLTRVTNGPENVQPANAARVVMNDFHYAQEMAMTYGRPVRVDVEPSLNLYSLKWDDTNEYLPSIMGTGQFIRRFGEDEFQHVTITGSSLTNNNLTFRTNGEPFTNGQSLLDDRTALILNGTWEIIVLPETGKITMRSR